jgi:predicted nucleic acid-binding protein
LAGARSPRVPVQTGRHDAGALWGSGLVRAAGSVDILIAGYAIANDATVLTADHDFDHIATVSDLQREYVAPSS